jgi:arabinan endo-1,5-alpha-L-arabinosidase
LGWFAVVGRTSELRRVSVLWLKWWGGDDNQRLLNFGLAPNDSGDAPDNYLSISPSGSEGVLTVQYRTNGDGRGDKLETSNSLETSDRQHITVVIREQSLSLFVDGESKATTETTHRLSDLDDDDNWLGRALYSGYPLYNGALFEFRVFNRALTDDEVAKLDQLGLELP